MLDKIVELIRARKIKWSGHILLRMQQRGIKINEVLNSIPDGDIIECYPDDYPYPSCLILGYVPEAKVGLHVVCALGQGYVWMITAYYPDEGEWLADLRTRRR